MMGTMRIPRVVPLLLLVFVNPAVAGVYGRLEKLPPVAASHRDMRLLLGELRDAGTHDEKRPVAAGSLRAEFIALREQLKNSTADGPASDLMDLAVCHLRLGQPEMARPLLESLQGRLEARDPIRFQVLANLATTYHELAVRGMGRDFAERAYLLQSQTLKAWPETASKAPQGWTLATWRFLLQAERAQLKMLRGRLLEATNPPPRFDPNQAGPDMVWDGPVYQVDPDSYRPGPADRITWESLPGDALDQARQLAVWFPMENRVFWLLGEMLNAAGENTEGLRVLEELASARQMRHVRVLTRHIEVLKASAPPAEPNAATAPETEATSGPMQPEVSADFGSFWRIFSVGVTTGAIGAFLARWQLATWFGRRPPR